MKGEEGVVIVYMVKWQCSFKDSWSRYRLVNIVTPGTALEVTLSYWVLDGVKASVLQCNVETRTRESAG